MQHMFYFYEAVHRWPDHSGPYPVDGIQNMSTFPGERPSPAVMDRGGVKRTARPQSFRVANRNFRRSPAGGPRFIPCYQLINRSQSMARRARAVARIIRSAFGAGNPGSNPGGPSTLLVFASLPIRNHPPLGSAFDADRLPAELLSEPRLERSVWYSPRHNMSDALPDHFPG